MRQVELVVHCWAEKRPVFAHMLTAQLSSLVLWRPKCIVKVTVFCTPGDKLTAKVLAGFRATIEKPPNTVWVRPWHVPPPCLFRRAIGRDMAGKASTADVVWFADCDYLFTEGPDGKATLDHLAEHTWTTQAGFPAQALIHKTHATGDAEMARVVPGEVWEPDLSLFQPWKPPGAIGGLQIVPGDVARRGYCTGTKWLNPTNAADFQDTREDRVYRCSIPGPHTRLDLPGLYRLRHTDSAFETAEQRVPKVKQ
jgi:hypothetical protein